ncbi:MAG: hypothetical protein ABR577_13075 [Pyrinomonadaceae bacterium]
MTNKRILTAFCILTLAIGALAFSRRTRPTIAAASQTPQPASIPDHVAYGRVFHHFVVLKKNAEEAALKGKIKEAASFRSVHKRQADLSDDQDRTLDEIASDCEREVAGQDAKAKLIIDAVRALYPNGKVPHGEKPPPPPADLKAMQEERNAMILKARDRLRVAFGEQEFNRFDDFVKRRIVPDIKPTTVNQP